MPKFAKGQSGNPAGRPKQYKRIEPLRALIGKYAEPIIKRLIKLAVEEGDTNAAKLLIERAIPPIKAIESPVVLPLADDADLTTQGRAVVAALARGIIPPGQAGVLLSGIASLAKLVESDELERRIAALESKRLNP